MLGVDSPNLDEWVAAVTQWRNIATSAGLSLDQINLRTADGSPLQFFWLDESNDWRIVTS